MWNLVNRTPFSAERTWLRDKRGAHLWVVVVKAVYALGDDGRLCLADEQPAPTRVPEFLGEPGRSSLRADADLVAPKPTTDVVVSGHAWAPRGRAVEQLRVAMRVGSISKQLVVHGPRWFRRGVVGMKLSSPERFERCPLIYEWAFGGTDTRHADPAKHAADRRNPIGKGFAVDRKDLADEPAPAIEYLDGDRAARGPAGLGPIPSFWSPRLELAGTYDARWEKTRKPLLAEDYDERHVLCAPADQQPRAHLRGGEPVELVNLSRHGTLRFTLPRAELGFVTRIGPRRIEHRGLLATVHLEPDASRVSLVWQASVPVASPDVEALDRTVVTEKGAAT